MKIGTIIRNHWAGKDNPMRYFIYLGTSGNYVNGVAINSSGKLYKCSYRKHDFDKRNIFEPVGYCEGIEIMKNDLKKIVKIGGQYGR